MPKSKSWIVIIGIIVTAGFAVFANLTTVLTWLGISPSSINLFPNNSISNCNANAPSANPYGPFYSQGAVFCIQAGQILVRNISVQNTGNIAGIMINGSYFSSGDVEFYILNSVQYGEFIGANYKSTSYKWFSGNTRGDTINATNLTIGDTYYLVFYNAGSTPGTITIQRSIEYGYKYGYT